MNLGKLSAFISSEIAFPCSFNYVFLEVQFDAMFYCKGFKPGVVLPPPYPTPLNLPAKGCLSRDSVSRQFWLSKRGHMSSATGILRVETMSAAKYPIVCTEQTLQHGIIWLKMSVVARLGNPGLDLFILSCLFINLFLIFLFYFAAFYLVVVSLDLGSSLIVW